MMEFIIALAVVFTVINTSTLIQRILARKEVERQRQLWRKQLDELESEKDIVNSRKACGCFGACAEAVLDDEFYYCEFKGNND